MAATTTTDSKSSLATQTTTTSLSSSTRNLNNIFLQIGRSVRTKNARDSRHDPSDVWGHHEVISVQRIFDFYDANKTGPHEIHEYLDGKVMPYYDFDIKYDDAKLGDNNLMSDWYKCKAAIEKVWGTDARYIWHSACGAYGSGWKNSWHCIVRGMGYCEAANHIPNLDIEAQDKQIYKSDGKTTRQMFRAFGSTKDDGSRELQYFDYNPVSDDTGEIKQSDYRLPANGFLADPRFPRLEDHFVQWIGDETESYLPYILRELDASEVVSDSKEIKRERLPSDGKYRKISREELREHIANLSPTRVSRAGTSRHRIVWAIANYAMQIGEDLHAEARLFRSLDKADWDNGGELSADNCYEVAKSARKHLSGIATILACSREDNEEGFKMIIGKYRLEGIEIIASHEIRCFRDYTKFSERAVNIDTIKEWIRSCIYPCITGKGVVYLILHNDYDSDNEDLFNASHKVCKLEGLKEMCKRVPIECKNPNKVASEKRPVCYNLWDVADWLLMRESIVPAFSRFDFIPYNKPIKLHHQIFNTFIPFEMTRYIPRTEIKFEGSPWQQHIKTEICNNDSVDPGLYMWFICQIATLIQYPGKPGQLFIALFSAAHGTGKSMVGKWVTLMLGLAYCLTYARAADFFAHFNAIQEGKIFVFLEETGEQDEMDKNANQFKASIDCTHVNITYKGLDTFRARNILHLWASTNKRNFMHMPGDERRTVIIEVNERFAQNRTHFAPIDADLKNPDYIKACFDYFSSVDLTGFDSCEPFVTQIKRSRKNECKNVTMRFIEAIFNETDLKDYHKHTTEVFDDYKLWAKQVEGIADRDMPRATGFARNMTQNGFIAAQTGGRGDRKSYYTITRDAARNLIRSAIKNPDFKFLSDD